MYERGGAARPPWRTRLPAAVTVSALLAWGGPLPADAQAPLEGSRLIRGPGVGLPWLLQADAELRAVRGIAPSGLTVTPTVELGVGLPGRTLVGGRFTPQSPVVPGKPDEWEVRAQVSALAEEREAPLDVVVTAGYNGAATSFDTEVTVGRWLGPLRLLASGRAMTDALGTGSSRGAAGAGVVYFPRPRALPVSLSADVVSLLDPDEGERAAWSAGATLGVPYTTHSVSVFVTNTVSGTLQGTTWGQPRSRVGIAFTAPIPIGRMLDRVVPRAAAMEAVAEVDGPSTPAVSASIFRYAYPERRIEIEAGQTVAWTNRDEVVHTVTADDQGWNSAAIEPGERWEARFDEPGIYPFHCGPHPYMRAVVVVR